MELFDFIKKSPEAYHVVATLREELKKEGFVQLEETSDWELKPDGKYFVVRGGTSLIAFCVPKADFEGFHVVAAHTDSPCFKVKENAEISVENQYVKLNIEKYGGTILSPWLDRPLSIAGRVIVRGENGCEERLYHADRDLLIIPNLAIHMNADANKGYTYKMSKDMCPLFAKEGSLKSMIAKEMQVEEDDILGTDLFVYNRMEGTVLGCEGEFIAAPRLDDLQCVYSGWQAFAKSRSKTHVTMLCAFDNEEVGSTTRQGAGADFFGDVLERIALCVGKDRTGYLAAIAKSFVVSADNAHGLHPNYTEKADATNRPYLNGGVVIKYNGCGKYITDGVSAALFKMICEKAKVPYQEYFNHSDVAGGSTLGHILAAKVSMRGVDIGLAQLAMHSPYETAGARDTQYLIQALQAFYEGSYQYTKDGEKDDVSVYSI